MLSANQIDDLHCAISEAKVPRLAFAVRLRDNIQAGELSADLFLEWLRHIPTIAEQVKVEAGFPRTKTVAALVFAHSSITNIFSLVVPKLISRTIPALPSFSAGSPINLTAGR